jgi:hypothetical protein
MRWGITASFDGSELNLAEGRRNRLSIDERRSSYREELVHVTVRPEQNTAGLPAYVRRTGDIRILFVEDDEYYRETLVAELSEHGFVVHSFADASSLLGSLDSAGEADPGDGIRDRPQNCTGPPHVPLSDAA